MTDDEVIALYKNKSIQLSEICKITGLSEYKILQIMRKNNITLRGTYRTKNLTKTCPDVKKFIEICADPDLSNKDIAALYKVSISIIGKWIFENNISRTFRNNEGEIPSKEQVIEDLKTLTMPDCAKKYKVAPVTIRRFIKLNDIEYYKSFKEIRNSPQYISKLTKTNKEKYGYDYAMQSPEFQEKLKDFKKSKAEVDCISRINEFCGTNLNSTRLIIPNGKELDGYDAEYKIAIEYCGLYWHSEKAGKHKNYHYNKFKECKEKGIKLFTIFEDEWRDNSDKILKYIYMNIGKAKHIIPARKTKFVEIDKITAKNFCITNHIQNSGKFKYAYGLEYNNELVSLMTFGLHHRDSKQLVMNRYCGNFDIRVIGGASKIMKNSSNIFKQDIITWSDNRFSDGNVYEKMGCEFNKKLMPDYSWTDYINRLSKQSRKKSATGQPMELTEREYNESLGLSRIFDCGKIRWIYRYKE